MTYSLLLNEFYYTIRELLDLVYNTKVPEYGYLFTSTTILMFLLESKNVYKRKKLERQVKLLEDKLNEQEKNKEQKEEQ